MMKCLHFHVNFFIAKLSCFFSAGGLGMQQKPGGFGGGGLFGQSPALGVGGGGGLQLQGAGGLFGQTAQQSSLFKSGATGLGATGGLFGGPGVGGGEIVCVCVRVCVYVCVCVCV